MAVVRALDLHDVVAPGRGARDADRVSSSPRCRSSRSAPARGRSAGRAPRRAATVGSVGAAKCVPVRAARSIASTIFGCAWPTTIDAEAAVEVDVLVAVDVPDVRALPSLEVDRVRVADLERRADAERHRARPRARSSAFDAGRAARAAAPFSLVGDLGGPCAQAIARQASVLDRRGVISASPSRA